MIDPASEDLSAGLVLMSEESWCVLARLYPCSVFLRYWTGFHGPRLRQLCSLSSFRFLQSSTNTDYRSLLARLQGSTLAFRSTTFRQRHGCVERCSDDFIGPRTI